MRRYEHTKTLILGDFNSKNPAWGGAQLDQRGEQLTEFILAHDLFIINDPDSPPTFNTTNGRSWIDLTLCTHNLIRYINSWEVMDELSGSDHNYIKLELFEEFGEEEYVVTKKGQLLINEAISKDDWFHQTEREPITSLISLKNTIATFYQKINTLRKKHCIKIKKSTLKRTNIWWTEELNIQRKRVRAMRRRYQNAKNAHTELKECYKQQYHTEFTQYKDNIKKSKTNSWHNLINELTKTNIFSLPYKLALNKIKKRIILPKILKTNGTYTTNTTETVQEIMSLLFADDNPNEYNLFRKETCRKILTPPNSDDDPTFENSEIDHIISKLKKKTAPGMDLISTEFIESLHRKFKHLFKNIFNAALQLGYFPEEWKVAKLILIPKKDGPLTTHADFRPICITPIIGKILEKLLNNRIYHFLHHNKHLNPNQFGFTHQKSSTIALYKMHQHIKEVQRNKGTPIIISLDISGAFNSLWTPYTLDILKTLDCPKNIFSLLKSCILNRKITYTSQSDEITKSNVIGSPQGSPVSPLLWNLLVSTLLSEQFHDQIQISAFADDITIIAHGNTRKEIESVANETLDQIHQWGLKYCLNFNPNKCSFVILGNKYHKRPPTIKIGNSNIKCVKVIKILGVLFDSQLSFLPHLEYVRQSTITKSIQLSAFSGSDWGINPQQFKEIYIRSLERAIVYAAPVWYKKNNNSHQLRKIKSIQRMPLIKICKTYKTVRNDNLNILSNIKPLKFTILKEISNFELFQLKEQPSNTQFDIKDIQYEVDLWEHHPSKLLHFPYTDNAQPNNNNSNKYIYTDGSVCNKSVGSAFVMLNQEGIILHYDRYKLPDYSTIFDAELIAIKTALEYIENLHQSQNETITLISDSLSSLQAIANPYNTNELVHQIKRKALNLNTTQGHELILQHIKSHSNNFGNDLADNLANQARTRGKFINLKMSKQYIKKQLEQKAIEEWNMEWRQSGGDSQLYKWVPSISLIPPAFPSTFYLSQLFTGHGRFPFYFKKIKLLDHSRCTCGIDATSVEHYFGPCKITRPIYLKIKKNSPNTMFNGNAPNLLTNNKNIKLLEEMIKLINQQEYHFQ